MSGARGLVALADAPYDRQRPLTELEAAIDLSPMPVDRRRETCLSSRELVATFDDLPGQRLQDRWLAFEWQVWPRWLSGVGCAPDRRWSFGVATLIATQAARPSWPFLECTYTRKWVRRLPEDAPLAIASQRLTAAVEVATWASGPLREKAIKTGLRVMMVAGYTELDQVTEQDLRDVPLTVSGGSDVLDAALGRTLLLRIAGNCAEARSAAWARG